MRQCSRVFRFNAYSSTGHAALAKDVLAEVWYLLLNGKSESSSLMRYSFYLYVLYNIIVIGAGSVVELYGEVPHLPESPGTSSRICRPRGPGCCPSRIHRLTYEAVNEMISSSLQ
jgi:hypothetical protein